jgi:hypothetical protein
MIPKGKMVRRDCPADLLTPAFDAVHVNAAVGHFERMSQEFQKGRWEESIAKGGKFIEAALKAVWIRATGTPPQKGKAFKVDTVINTLPTASKPGTDDSLRLTIPRATRFIYEVASNRGGRHDPDEVNPNEMDAYAVLVQSSWILAEMVRHAQHGKAGMQEAKDAVDSLMRRRYPLVEEIDGKTYFHASNPSAPEVALVILSRNYPKRITPSSLLAQLQSNKFTEKNARTALDRIDRYLHHDDDGKIVLLEPGLQKAEGSMAAARIATEKRK